MAAAISFLVFSVSVCHRSTIALNCMAYKPFWRRVREKEKGEKLFRELKRKECTTYFLGWRDEDNGLF